MRTIDDLLEKFDLHRESDEKEGALPITLWLPAEVKAKYDLLQMKSKRRFGKLLKEIVIHSIERKAQIPPDAE